MNPPSNRSGVTLVINLDALAANYSSLKGKLTAARCASVVKADAYGLGIWKIAPVLVSAGCNTFFVATLDEGIELRNCFLQNTRTAPKIYVLNGPPDGAQEDLITFSLTPVLNTPEQLILWRNCARKRGIQLACAIHLDTGMARLGLSSEEVNALANDPMALEGINPVLIMSHLACAEESGHPLNHAQLERFRELKSKLPSAPASLANSSGIFLGEEYHFNIVRPGIALYGANPCPGHENPMTEVVRLQGKITQVRVVDSPITVGYGATYSVSRPGRIVTVPIGYADGLPRSLSNRGFAYVGDVRVPIVGRVSMDLITLDVTDLPPHLTAPGSTVDFIGGYAAIDDVADAADTIAYEILTRLGQRFERIYKSGVA